jgi:tetraacyldisaccharide 4'-kinase
LIHERNIDLFRRFPLLKILRYFLIPFSVIYGTIIKLRNWLFDKGILKSASFNFPLICVGNLATGGTGKTPMTEYLAALLKDKYKTATLSRGYKRKTKGFAIAGPNTTAIEIGDEPMQFHQKFPDVTVTVGEERLEAIPLLLHDRPDTQVIILDDAFQHRTVKAGLNILLTEHRKLYVHDLMLPAGDLRDVKSSSSRADIIIVSKCRKGLDGSEKKKIIQELDIMAHQQIFFTEIVYSAPYHLFQRTPALLTKATDILLVTGIANPDPLKELLASEANSFEMLSYRDHHIFTSDDLREIVRQFDKISSDNKMILTTEKDGVRMEKFRNQLANYPIYVLPMRIRFLFEEGEWFNSKVISFVDSYYDPIAKNSS